MLRLARPAGRCGWRGVCVKLRERQCTHTKSPHNEAAKWEHAPRYNENGAHRNRQKEANIGSHIGYYIVFRPERITAVSLLRPFLCGDLISSLGAKKLRSSVFA